jgi:hypothetical protein
VGWIGLTSELLHTLNTVGADHDPHGAFLLTGTPVACGLDPEECVVTDGTCSLRHGQPAPLGSLLNRTSYGVAVTVIP